jgi:hypothetical protein
MEEWRFSSTILDLCSRWKYLSYFTRWERAPGTHWTGGWVDARAGLNVVEWKKILLLLGIKTQPSIS